jgi:L-asparagine transporter-like permease
MNFVVLTAALSSMNTNIYLTSRMLFSLARGSYAPKLLGTLSANGTPVGATILSGICILLAASVSRLTPYAYNYLFGIALFGGLSVWMIILFSHLSFRRHHKNELLPVRTPFFPYLQILGILLLSAILITMGLDTDFWNISWIVGVPWMIAVSIAYLVWKRAHRNEAGALSAAGKPGE